MHLDNSNFSREYYAQKMKLLRDCLSLSEELLSRLEEWEALDDILTRRGTVIQAMQNLDEMYPDEVIDACSQAEKLEANRLLSLILNLDHDTEKLIRQERERILSSIKENVQEQRITGYGASTVPSGYLMDHKK